MTNISVDLPFSSNQIIPINQSRRNGTVSLVELSGCSQPITYKVIHEIPGRVRLRVPQLGWDDKYVQRLQTVLEADNLIESFRIKSAAASLVVTYQPTVTKHQLHRHISHLLHMAANVTTIPTKPPDVGKCESKWQISTTATTLAVLRVSLGLPIPPVLIVGAITWATLPVAKRAWQGLIEKRQLSIDLLDLIAIAITTMQGHLITPSLMLSLIEIGENIRDRTARSSAQQSLDLLSSLGQFAWVERHGEKQQISISDVQPGDTVIVYPGEQVPVDGVILQGKALIDEQKLTGESVPILKQSGQTVYASTLIREGRIYITAERIGEHTCAGQTIKLMQQVPIHDTRMENYAAKIAQKAVMPTLLLGGLVFATTANLARAASILSLDFATGIRVSIPTTVLAALTYAARRGILIRSGRALEKLAAIDTIVFDKTGTLTKGEVAVVKVESLNPHTSISRILTLAASAEQRLTHPVAEAIINYATEQKVEILPRKHWEYQLGLGVQAEIDSSIVHVGSDRFLRHKGINMSALAGETQPATAIYIAANGELQGKIEYRDMLRPETREVITALLTAEGMEVHMLTGDNHRTAMVVGAELGIEPTHIHAEAFPEQKASVVSQLHQQGKTVAFVGDGINDSPALAYADVSVSFANGSDIARETADVVLMENNLHGLLTAIDIAHQAKQLIGQNTSIIAFPNLTALIVAVMFGLNPLAATLVNNGSTVVAGVNGLRPILQSRKDRTLPSAR